MNKQQEHASSCYSLLLGQFQLKLFYCGKGRQNFASNVTLYPCERSRQNHLDFCVGGIWCCIFGYNLELINVSRYQIYILVSLSFDKFRRTSSPHCLPRHTRFVTCRCFSRQTRRMRCLSKRGIT